MDLPLLSVFVEGCGGERGGGSVCLSVCLPGWLAALDGWLGVWPLCVCVSLSVCVSVCGH